MTDGSFARIHSVPKKYLSFVHFICKLEPGSVGASQSNLSEVRDKPACIVGVELEIESISVEFLGELRSHNINHALSIIISVILNNLYK